MTDEVTVTYDGKTYKGDELARLVVPAGITDVALYVPETKNATEVHIYANQDLNFIIDGPAYDSPAKAEQIRKSVDGTIYDVLSIDADSQPDTFEPDARIHVSTQSLSVTGTIVVIN